VTCSVKWSSVPGTLVDLSMYDPTGTSKSTSLATTDMGNAAVVANPIAGTWTVDLGYGNPTLPAPTAAYALNVDYVGPQPIDGFTSSANSATPLTIAPDGGSGTIHASIHVPADAESGDVIEGRIDFYTVANGITVAGRRPSRVGAGDDHGAVARGIQLRGPRAGRRKLKMTTSGGRAPAAPAPHS